MRKLLAILFFLPLAGYSQQWQLGNASLTIDISKNSGTVIHVGKWLATFSVIGDSVKFTYQRNNDDAHFVLYIDKDSVTSPVVASATALYDTLLSWTTEESKCHEIIKTDTLSSCSSLIFVPVITHLGDTTSVDNDLIINGDFTISNNTINTTAGDTATINSIAGRFRKDTSGTTFTLTNSFCTANSIILLTLDSDPANSGTYNYYVIAGSGSFVITFENAPNNNTDINFFIVN